MYFYNETHQTQFEELVGLEQQGGQQNERLSSLYVAALLPAWTLASFKEQEYVMFADLIEFTKEDHPKNKRLTKNEAQLIRLAYTLFHGADHVNAPLHDYLGYGYEFKEVVVQALQLHYGLITVPTIIRSTNKGE